MASTEHRKILVLRPGGRSVEIGNVGAEGKARHLNIEDVTILFDKFDNGKNIYITRKVRLMKNSMRR